MSDSHLGSEQPKTVFSSSDRDELNRLVALARAGADINDLTSQSIEMFWSVLAPEVALGGTRVTLSAGGLLASDADDRPESQEFVDFQQRTVLPAMLHQLDGLLSGDFSVSLGPDLDLTSASSQADLVSVLLGAQHIACAKAMLLVATRGYSEESRDWLDRARRLGTAINIRWLDSIVNPERAYSSLLVQAVAQFHLALVARHDGEYGEAFHYITNSISCCDEANCYELQLLSESELYDPSAHWLTSIDDCMIDYRFMSIDVINALDDIFANANDVDWKMVIEDCRTIEGCDEVIDLFQIVVDKSGSHREGFYFLSAAIGRAMERVSPTELQKLQWDLISRDQYEESEKRLRTYFFQNDLWTSLPRICQDRLRKVDNIWFHRRQSIDSALADLQVATEALCSKVIWTPLRDATASPETDWLEALTRKLKSWMHPNLSTYANFCATEAFGDYLSSRAVPDELSGNGPELAAAFRRLCRPRNRVVHHHDQLDRSDVEAILREYFGIGQRGILVYLARLAVAIDCSDPEIVTPPIN